MSAVYFKFKDQEKVLKAQNEVGMILDMAMERFKKISEGAYGTYNFGTMGFKLQQQIDAAKAILQDVLFEG